MQRLTFSLDDDIVAMIDEFMAKRGATNRSEALRDIVRLAAVREHVREPGEQQGIATLSYVYDLDKHELWQRLRRTYHARHDLSMAKLTVQLDHNTGLDVSILRGPIRDMKVTADILMNERGVRHGNLHVLPAVFDTHRHEDGVEHSHIHVVG